MDSQNTASPLTRQPSKALHITLWAIQGLLAVAFGFAGFIKLAAPIPDLTAQMAWAGDIPAALVRFIGPSELLAAVGLTLPAALRIQPRLTPLAAVGLVVVMALAVVFHLMRGEAEALPINLVFGALAAFVAWGRSRNAPIAARSSFSSV